MAQFRGIRVRVQNGSATVRQVLKANGTPGGVGAFGAAEALSWPSGGIGVYVQDNGVQFEFYRTSGPHPGPGTVISGASDGSVPTWTISSYPAENLILTAPVAASPALFSTTGGTQGPIATNDEFALVSGGQPVAKVSATIAADSFDLTSAWTGSTLTAVEAVIHRERTVNQGWPLVKAGTRAPFVLLEEVLRLIDAWSATVGSSGGGVVPTAFTNFTLANSWANLGGGRPSAGHALHDTGTANRNTVELQGYINRSGSATTGETIVAAASGLPSGRRPASIIEFAFEGERFAIRPDGSITFEGVGGMAPGPISFAGVRFRADGS